MFNTHKYTALEILVLIVISFTPLFWFQKNHIILGLDSGYAIDHIRFFLFRMNTWMPNPNFGVDMSAEMGLLPLVSLPAIISYLGVSIFNVQKVLLVGWFFILCISMYLLLHELFPKKDQWTIRLIGTLIYVFNFHLYAFWLQGEQPMFASYAILPLFTLFLYRFATGREKILSTAVYLNIAYLLFSSGGIRGVPLIGPVILTSLILFVYYAVLNWKKSGFSYIVRFVYLFLLFVIFAVPLNAYWIFPFISSFSHEFNNQVTIAGGISGAVSWARFISTYDSFLNIMRLQGDNNWYFFPFLWSNNYLVNPLLIIASFTFPIFAFGSLLFTKGKQETRIIILFALLAIISLFFTAGAHPPFGGVYAFMMEHIPGFATFRSAYYKFMPTVVFSYAVLIGFTVYSICLKMKKKAGYIFSAAFILFFLTYNYPFFQNTNAAFNKPFSNQVEIPKYVMDFKEMIQDSNVTDKTLVVPETNTRNTIKAYKWGYYGSFSLFALMTDRPFVQYDAYLFNDSANSLISTMYDNLRNNDVTAFQRAAKTTGIKYILLTNDVANNYKVVPLEDPSLYKKILSNPLFFKKIWSEGEWTLYKINNLKVDSLINATAKVSVISPDATQLGSYFQESGDTFVLRDQINESVLSKLSKGSVLSGYSCISCNLPDILDLPTLEYSNILPGSLLYPFKIQNDRRLLSKTSDPSQKVDVALGLSIKRASELFGLTARADTLAEENKFFIAVDLLQQNWNLIEKYLKSSLSYPDYVLYAKIHRYAYVEEDALKRLLSSGRPSKSHNLAKGVKAITTRINKLDQELQKILNEKDWRSNFVFKVDDNVQINDLKVNLGKNLIKSNPTPVIKKESDTLSYASVSQLPIYHNANPNNLLNLEVDNAPVPLIETDTKTITVKGELQTCLLYPVKNFYWNTNYTLSGTALDDDVPKTVYVKMTHGIMKTADSIVPDPSGFVADYNFSPTNKKGTVSNFEFSGLPNDTAATVYVCTNKQFDPHQVLGNLSLQERITPQIYTYKNISQNKSGPNISYKKINATKYLVTVHNAKKPFILNFLQTASPNWKAYINGEEQKDKFMVNGFANAWYIQKTGSYQITLEFYPQQGLYKGVVITTMSFLIVIIYLLWEFKKKK